MTMNRFECTASKADQLLTEMSKYETSTIIPIIDVARVYQGEHADLGHTILIQHLDGSATVLADQVRFVPAPDTSESIGGAARIAQALSERAI